jgi:hypothetical protein
MDVAKHTKMDKIYNYFFSLWNEVASNLMTALAGAIVTWIFNPRPKFWHNFLITVGSVIMGTLIGYSIDHSGYQFLVSIKYGVITLFGMYAVKLYKFFGEKMSNPLAFFKEIRQSIEVEVKEVASDLDEKKKKKTK